MIPAATGIAPALTPLAAGCLCVVMAGAVHTHRRLGESFAAATVTGALCVFIAVGRAAIGAP